MNNPYLAGSVIRLLVPLIVGGAGFLGLTVGAEDVYNILCIIAAIITAFYMWWWKDNPITKAAQEAENLYNALREAEKEDQE